MLLDAAVYTYFMPRLARLDAPGVLHPHNDQWD